MIPKPGDLPGSPHVIVFADKTGEGVQNDPGRLMPGRFFLGFLS